VPQTHFQRYVLVVGFNSKPVMAKFDCRMIEVLPTSTQPMRGFADRMMAMEGHSELSELSEIKKHIPGDPHVLSVSCIHGFMAADVECMGSAMLVVTDNQPEKAARIAQELGMELFELRGTTRPEYLHPQAGIDRAIAADKTPKPGFDGEKMPAVIADVWVRPDDQHQHSSMMYMIVQRNFSQ
jgi:microcystin degradation protein MlrC